MKGSVPLASGAALLSEQVSQTDLLTIMAAWDRVGRAKIAMGYAPPADTWHYAPPSGGITTTAPIQARAAPGAGVRIYVTRAQVINGHATVSTEVQIRDGASGPVVWRPYATAQGGGATAEFDPPLRLSVNTLLEVACATGRRGGLSQPSRLCGLSMSLVLVFVGWGVETTAALTVAPAATWVPVSPTAGVGAIESTTNPALATWQAVGQESVAGPVSEGSPGMATWVPVACVTTVGATTATTIPAVAHWTAAQDTFKPRFKVVNMWMQPGSRVTRR